MSFDLRIHFSGLMTWVPEGNTAMHVLLPSGTHVHPAGGDRGGVHGHEHDVQRSRRVAARTRVERSRAGTAFDHAHENEEREDREDDPEAVEEHFVRLVYDIAYEQPTATQLSREYVMVDLHDRVLDLTGLSAPEGIDVRLPDELASLDAAGFPAPRSLVQQMPAPPLAARVSMDAGVLTDYQLGAPFIFLGASRRISPVTEWTIRGIASRMPAALGGGHYLPGQLIRGPDETQERPLPNLFPIGQTIHLMVFNMVANQFLPHHPRFKPEGDGEDTHFEAYFDLLQIPKEQRPRPPRSDGFIEVPVRGDRVNKKGEEDPGSVCGQTSVSLQPE